jgi:hypothetical protein
MKRMGKGSVNGGWNGYVMSRGTGEGEMKM